MTFELSHLFAITVGYLLILFVVAYATEENWLPRRLVRHPATYVLSLGVYATSWSYYGSVGFAETEGYNFLTVYLGVTLTFILAPVLLIPIFRITRDFQLTSLADVFAFRYRSQLAGVLVTLFMLVGTLPYIALQIRAVTRSMQVLTQEATPDYIAMWFCITISIFAVLFGARHISPREKHQGLVVAIAFESLIKLVAILVAGIFALYGVFGGTSGLDEWLSVNPAALEALYQPVREGSWPTFLLLSFAAAFLLPRQFHMTFTENTNPKALPVASWGFPLLLLLFNLFIPVILWAGQRLSLGIDADYYVLGVTQWSGSGLLSVMVFIGGLSAASAMIIVTSLALSHMCMNHILLPASYPDPRLDLYRWLLWGRRLMIGLIIMFGFFFYLILEHRQGLVQLGLISFVAVAQFLPGIVGLLYWPRANRQGFIAGLVVGALIWAYTLLVPLFHQAGITDSDLALHTLMSLSGQNKWSFSTFWSLAANTFVFALVSLLTRTSEAEEQAAQACMRGTPLIAHGRFRIASPQSLIDQLAAVVGRYAAEQEVDRALQDLNLSRAETRPVELQRLKERIELNMSGLLGPAMARMIIRKRVHMDQNTRVAFSDSVRYFEEKLGDSLTQMRGLESELDALRRYHRQVLLDLPVGVCALDNDGEILIWNLAMELVSGIDRQQVIGKSIQDLPPPWCELLSEFIDAKDQHQHKVRVRAGQSQRWFNLHKSLIESTQGSDQEAGQVILVEDLTDVARLESELAHTERLASIGRFSAGVAHEIGNPVTGIACLAQNLRYEEDPALVKESIDQILQQTGRITDIVQTLVGFSHGGSLQSADRARFTIQDCANEAVRLVQLTHAGKQVSCDNEIPPQLTLLGERQKFVQVFVNLLTNACDACQPGDHVRLRAQAHGGGVEIEVQDQGSGISEEALEQVFEPFYTTKEPGEGTGLGLPLVYSIVQDHGGHIRIDSDPGGTCVRLRFPPPEPSSRGDA